MGGRPPVSSVLLKRNNYISTCVINNNAKLRNLSRIETTTNVKIKAKAGVYYTTSSVTQFSWLAAFVAVRFELRKWVKFLYVSVGTGSVRNWA